LRVRRFPKRLSVCIGKALQSSNVDSYARMLFLFVLMSMRGE
jgi:hypothetical protein